MDASNQLVRLRAGRTAAFDPSAGEVLRVLRGRLWVTQTGNAADHFVAARQALALGAGRVVLEADLGVTAVYEIRRPVPAHAPVRGQQLPRGAWTTFPVQAAREAATWPCAGRLFARS